MNPIRAWHDVTPDTFQQIRAAAEPAVLKAVAAGWPLVRAADPAGWLRERAHAGPVRYMQAPPEVEGRMHYGATIGTRNFARREAPFAAFLDALDAEAGKARPDALALQGLPAPGLLPGFAEAHRLDFVPDVVPRLWIGNAAKVAVHHDPTENVAVVAAGRRRFTLFAPEQVGNLYMGPFDPTPAGVQVGMAHVTAPDFERYPRFAAALAAAQTADLEPGDALYIPYQWYHHVEALDGFNILVNYWWDPAVGGSPWEAMMHGFAGLRGLPADQRRAWRAMFDRYVFLTDGDPGEHLPAEARGVMGATSPSDIAAMRRALIASLQRK
ncbi:MAG: cupin-like domain-containing protein [Pseudomonadota bacterium]